MYFDQLSLFVKKYKIFIFIAVFFIVFIPILILILSRNITKPSENLPPSQSITPTNTSYSSSFRVIQTQPTNNASNVYSGEIQINVDLDNTVSSSNNIHFSFSPALQYQPTITSSFPTKHITLQILGGLTPATTYTVTIDDAQKNPIYSWRFTTSTQPGENSSRLIVTQEAQVADKYYPLASYLPYKTTDFTVDFYSDRLILQVTINNQSKPLDQIKQEVNDWIKSKGVDPTTHKITYIENGSPIE